jgi:hypothetical protein
MNMLEKQKLASWTKQLGDEESGLDHFGLVRRTKALDGDNSVEKTVFRQLVTISRDETDINEASDQVVVLGTAFEGVYGMDASLLGSLA